MKKPPKIVTILFCDECGRDDRYRAFTGKSHWARDGKCKGIPKIRKYRLTDS